MTRIFRAGGVEVELSDELEDFVERTLARAETAALRQARALAEEVAAEARREWYGPNGVNRKTGKSGDIRVREAVDVRTGTVTVSVGSTDDRRARGRPVPEFIRRPGRTSLVKRRVTHETYWRTPASLRANYHRLPQDQTPGPFIWTSNPEASDGKKMLDVYVKRPVRKRIKKAAAELGRDIAGVG